MCSLKHKCHYHSERQYLFTWYVIKINVYKNLHDNNTFLIETIPKHHENAYYHISFLSSLISPCTFPYSMIRSNACKNDIIMFSDYTRLSITLLLCTNNCIIINIDFILYSYVPYLTNFETIFRHPSIRFIFCEVQFIQLL